MQIAFHTLGCKVNIYETETLKQKFLEAGHSVVEESQWAHVYVVNTCSVTSIAEKKSRQYIRKMKKQNPDSIVVVTGCYAQVDEKRIAALPEVDIVMGINEKHRIVEQVMAYGGQSVSQVRKYKDLVDFKEMGALPLMENKNRSYIKIQEGCDRFCSYCIIPYARGPVRVREEEEILKEVRAMIDQNYKELVITGINTALYPELVSLLQKIDEMEGDFRVRLSSLEPTVVNKNLVKELFPLKKLCHHLHLSLQSGSDKILRDMNRKYTIKEYKEIIETIKEFDPLYGISSDIIVGFPGEGDAEFKETLRFVEENNFCKWHVFPFSKRKGTRAEKMKNQVDNTEKKKRVQQLTEVAQRATIGYQKKLVGGLETVLFEQREGKDLIGYTDRYTKVYAQTDEQNLDVFVPVEIIGLEKDGVRGFVRT